MELKCKICSALINEFDGDGIIFDICETCYMSKEVKDSEKNLKGYYETKNDL